MRSLEGLGSWQGQAGLGQACRARVLKDCDEDKNPSVHRGAWDALGEGPWRTSEEEVEG